MRHALCSELMEGPSWPFWGLARSWGIQNTMVDTRASSRNIYLTYAYASYASSNEGVSNKFMHNTSTTTIHFSPLLPSLDSSKQSSS